MHLTPDMLESGYRLLCHTPPFNRWKMPHPDDVVFYAKTIDKSGTHGTQGQYWFDNIHHHIQVNPARHHTLAAMLMTLAHEMVHLRVGNLERGAHGRLYQRLADQVCRHHGFDRGQF